MKNSLKPIIGILLFAALLLGAKLLYDNLGGANSKGPVVSTEPATVPNATAATTTANVTTTTPASTTIPVTTTTPATKSTTVSKTKLPNFEVYDRQGNKTSIDSFFGKKLIVNIWASWCGPCKVEMPDFLALDKELTKDSDTVIVMVNLTFGMETMENATKYLDENKLDFKNMFFDTKQSAGASLAIRALPTTVFVDKEGYIYKYHEGTMRKAAIEKILKDMD